MGSRFEMGFGGALAAREENGAPWVPPWWQTFVIVPLAVIAMYVVFFLLTTVPALGFQTCSFQSPGLLACTTSLSCRSFTSAGIDGIRNTASSWSRAASPAPIIG